MHRHHRPHTCPWGTTAGADGAYELRAVATDTSGYTATSAVIGTQVVGAGSIVSGWDGSVRAVTVSLVDNGTNDTLTFPGTNLGTVALGQNFVKKNKTITFAGTIAASTTTSGGVSRSVVTVTLGAQNGGGTVTTPAAGNDDLDPPRRCPQHRGTALLDHSGRRVRPGRQGLLMLATSRPASRATALAMGLVALVVLVQLPAVWAAAPYVGVLDLLCGPLTLLTGALIWRGRGLEPLHGFHPWDGVVTALEVAAAVLLVRTLSLPRSTPPLS